MENDVQISSQQAALMARGLYALARVDGHEEREGMLISSFWHDAVGPSRMSELASLSNETDFEIEQLVHGLNRPDLRDAFVRTALMLCYADGKMSPAEKTWLWATAARLGLDATVMQQHDEAVRSYLLGQLSHLKNVEALREVAKELGLAE